MERPDAGFVPKREESELETSAQKRGRSSLSVNFSYLFSPSGLIVVM